MVSWPHPTRNRTAVTGEISHPGRQFDELSPVNPLGFTTMLSEVQIRSEQGSSGGPLLNGQVQVTGLLHGGNGSFSFFISLPNGDSLYDLLALIQHCSAPFTSFWMLCVWVNMLRLFWDSCNLLYVCDDLWIFGRTYFTCLFLVKMRILYLRYFP